MESPTLVLKPRRLTWLWGAKLRQKKTASLCDQQRQRVILYVGVGNGVPLPVRLERLGPLGCPHKSYLLILQGILLCRVGGERHTRFNNPPSPCFQCVQCKNTPLVINGLWSTSMDLSISINLFLDGMRQTARAGDVHVNLKYRLGTVSPELRSGYRFWPIQLNTHNLIA